MIWRIAILSGLVLALASCDDDADETAVMLGGGPGSSDPSASQTVNDGIPSGYTPGQPITTMSSEFGYVDDPNGAYHGNGDPGTTGNFYTGAGGQYIGGMNSTGISLPAATEIAIYGSTQAAQ